MPIEISGSAESGGAIYEDASGGYLQFVLASPAYTSHHKFRVAAFDTSGTGVYVTPLAGHTVNIQQDMDNLITLLAALFAADTSGAFNRVFQVYDPVAGVNPYPFIFGAGSAFAVGTAGGASNGPATMFNLNGVSVEGARWSLRMGGFSTAVLTNGAAKLQQAAFGVEFKALADYISQAAVGPTHALLSQILAHDGDRILASMTGTGMTNKRIRRHLGLV